MKGRTLSDLARGLASGELTSARLVGEALERIADPAGEGARTFIRRFDKEAKAAAQAADDARNAGRAAGPLAGIPVSVKDLCDVAGSVTTAGSIALKGNPPAAADAPVVARLRAAGAVIVGTTNMTEFAMGGPGINPHYGTPLNPYDRATGRLPGGSSSGAAISVTDGMAAAALGTDTAGSIQMPAAFCGLVGFKPTAARVPLSGTVPLAPSLDSIGPLARSVSCCAVMDAVLSGAPARTIAEVPPRGLRFAVPKTLVLDDLEAPVARAFSAALFRLSAAGVRIAEIPFTELNGIAEAYARGTFSVIEGYAWHRRLLEKHAADYDPIVASRFMRGANVSAADYIDLINARARLIQITAAVTAPYDAVVMPTLPLVAPPLADFSGNEPLWLSTNLRMTRNPGIANFLDRCAVSLPCHPDGTAPVGLSVMGAHMDDDRLLGIGLTVERILRGATT